jgi:hypothetical protein
VKILGGRIGLRAEVGSGWRHGDGEGEVESEAG